MAHIVEILIASSPKTQALPLLSVRAVPGRGLVGDRYHDGDGTFSPQPQQTGYELTLIQQEHIEAFAASSGIAFTARDARRNLVTVGVDLNSLVDREFHAGPVLIRGICLCEPCEHLAKQTAPGIKLWPPERIFTSSLCSVRYFTASLSERGA